MHIQEGLYYKCVGLWHQNLCDSTIAVCTRSTRNFALHSFFQLCSASFAKLPKPCMCTMAISSLFLSLSLSLSLCMQEGIWGAVQENERGIRMLTTARVQPGYVTCQRQGRLPGCRFEFDNINGQCREGRMGESCEIEQGGWVSHVTFNGEGHRNGGAGKGAREEVHWWMLPISIFS